MPWSAPFDFAKNAPLWVLPFDFAKNAPLWVLPFEYAKSAPLWVRWHILFQLVTYLVKTLGKGSWAVEVAGSRCGSGSSLPRTFYC